MKDFNKLVYEFMIGRYGRIDSLNKTLFCSAFIVSMVGAFIRLPILNLISVLLIATFLFRFASKDISKRQQESYKFDKLYYPIKNKVRSWKFIHLLKQKYKYRKTHKIFLCKCGKIIRVPKNKGKIEVSCPNCGVRKIMKT